MKKKINILILALMVISSLTSCKKEEIEPNIQITKNQIIGKWIINETGVYKSLEFKKDGFSFVRKNEENTDPDFSTLGIFDIVEQNIIYIADFGALLVTNLTDDSIHFTLELTRNNTKYHLTANKATPISNSQKTDLLTKNWIIESINGQNSQSGIVLFTNAGTFYSFNQNAVENYGSWKWCNADETKIAITTNNSNLDCNSNQVIDEIQLTSSTFNGKDFRSGVEKIVIMKTGN